MSSHTDQAMRNEFFDAIKSRLIGPSASDETLHERPNKRYLTGMVFPKGTVASAAIQDEEDESANASVSEEQETFESPMDMLFQKLPASVGLTFALAQDAKSITVEIEAARYVRDPVSPIAEETTASGGKGAKKIHTAWRRHSLSSVVADAKIEFNLIDGDRQEKWALGGHAVVQLYVRQAQGVRVTTLSLINSSTIEEGKPLDVSKILFQVRMKCTPDTGVSAYPDPPTISEDPEAEELALQYRSLPSFAVGHGCGVAWPEAVGGVVGHVEVDYLPAVEVPPVTTEIDGLPSAVVASLSLHRLQDAAYDPIPAFEELLKRYRDWHGRLRMESVPARFDRPKQDVLTRIDAVIHRMEDGISLLRSTPDVMRLFRLANRAMLLSLARARANCDPREHPFRDIEIDALDPDAIVWRPFQIAFFLLSLRGLWDPAHRDRQIADLIWFPTGGGKTEAYLAVAAFEMLRRRVIDGERGGGTAVIKRYTLRLLTIQQFERAGGLICALETMRQRGEISSSEPFSLGLWVGNDSSPNDNSDKDGAIADLNKILAATGRVEGVRVPLKHCPVCATPIVPPQKKEGPEGVGLREVGGAVEVFCPNPHCCYHASLPISFIDTQLYASPPTMLLGTVDKFAMLAWRPEARAFFGTDEIVSPPSLIIQDELHLISGPLGSIAGIYEAAIDTAIARLGPPAKYICATATIRRADDQIRKLYGREACLFPPPGLDATDSFFSRARQDLPGRLYVGAMGQGHTPTFANVMASTALLGASGEMYERLGKPADTWYTLVAYHNSKRELGKTLSLARDDIPARLKALGEKRQVRGVQELSANLRDSEIPEVLHRLGVEMPSDQALDFVACTNMFSVGVDVSRLGLMMVNGQPKTVSEYIQASSRVGRDGKRLPGFVFALFSPTKPRDRSHYEFFRPFHKGYYRHVEPTSVTPYALPAQERGLHGAFLALVRMTSSLYANEAASQIVHRAAEIDRLADAFLTRVAQAQDGDVNETRECLEQFLSDWTATAKRKSTNLRFQSRGRQHTALIRPFRSPGEGKETLQSLRHVDTPLKLKVPEIQTGASQEGQ